MLGLHVTSNAKEKEGGSDVEYIVKDKLMIINLYIYTHTTQKRTLFTMTSCKYKYLYL